MLWLVILEVLNSNIMHLVSCEHPVRVYNKYIREYVYACCNKCNTCKKRRSSRWVARLEKERASHPFCFFVTLTYDDPHLPLLTYDGSVLVDKSRPKHSPVIEVQDLEFSTAADRQYFDSRMALGGIPYASSYDIQLFHKRLNKYFHDKVSYSFGNFRYFTVSEFGSTTLRPHFHSIYFVDEQSVADSFSEGIRESWQNGIIDCQSVQTTAVSYVSQYLNELFSLPSFYGNSQIRPRFFCSKRPPIGMCDEREEDFEEIFRDCLISRPSFESSSSPTVIMRPLLQCVENRLFPKCRAFDEIPHYLRVELYGLLRPLQFSLGFKEFLGYWYYLLVRPLRTTTSAVVEYLSTIADSFSPKGINALKRFYYMIKRVRTYAWKFNVTINEYVEHIEEYYYKKAQNALKEFYEFQQSYSVLHSFEQLVYCYPDFAYVNRDSLVYTLEECEDYQTMVADNSFYQKKATKSHFKNLYIDSLKSRGNPLFNILKTYLYAKKCDEVIEAYE